MKRLLPFLFLLLATVSQAATTDRITLTVTVTNVPVTGATFVLNATTRTWTNAHSSSTILTNLVGKNNSTTNLANNLASYPPAGPFAFRWLNTNQFSLIGPLGGSVSASAAGTWATLTLSTQSGPSTFTALWPLENIPEATNRTNQASAFVSGLSAYSTNAFATNSTAVSNHLQKGAGPLQRVDGPVYFASGSTISNGMINASVISNAVSISGVLGSLTNGYATNLTLERASLTNAVLYNLTATNGTFAGVSLIMVGSGVNDLLSMTATSAIAAAGSLIVLSRTHGITNRVTTNDVLGLITFSGYGDTGQTVGGRIRVFATEQFSDTSGASRMLFEITPTGAAQAVGKLNIEADTTTISNNLSVVNVASFGSITNGVLRGTNTINGRVDYTSRANTSLANGNNSGVVLGTNVYVRLSGATTIAYIAGFAAEQDGSYHIVEISGSVTNTIGNQSGVDATAANRIVTGTGGDVSFTNNPIVLQVIYNAADSRWKLMGLHR